MLTLLLVTIGIIVGVVIAVVVVRARRAHDRNARRDAGLVEDNMLTQVSRRVSRRLHLRRPEPSDVDFFLEMAADPVAVEANGWRETEVQIVRSHFATPKRFAALRASELVAIESSTGHPVATIRFTASPLGPAGARSIGVQVHPEHRNRSFGREVMASAILLLQASDEPIHVGTRTTNLGLQRIMKQLGFEPEPTTRAYAAPNGKSYEALWYDCSADMGAPAGLFDD